MNALEEVHRWVTQSLKHNNMSAREWALKAGVAPSTLQRFIKEKPWVLSATTIQKLSVVTNTFPNLSATDDSLKLEMKSLPLKANKKGKIVDTKDTYPVFGTFGPKAFAIPIGWKTMDLAGFKIGEIIVIDPDEKPKDGDVVLVKLTNSDGLFEVQQHMLLTRSTITNETHDSGLVDVIGKVVYKAAHYR
tara:strand:- start:751 stop:1320 length:570 start_codon:yes stop_codon:yes gene_type:complete